MNIYCLCQVVDSRFHFCQLTLLKVKQLEEVCSQTVDLVGYTGQRVGGVVLSFLQSSTLVCSLNIIIPTVLSYFLQIFVTILKMLASIGDLLIHKLS